MTIPVQRVLQRNLVFLGITGAIGVAGIALNASLPIAGMGTTLLGALATLLMICGMFTGWGSYLLGQDRRAVQAFVRGEEPKTGHLAAVGGKVSTTGDPLVAPFTGATGAACEYTVHRVTRSRRHSGSSSTGTSTRRRTIHLDGRHLAPTAIETAHGQVQIAALPSLEEFVSEDPDVERAREFVQALPESARCGFFRYMKERGRVNRGNPVTLAKDWWFRPVPSWDGAIELDERVLPVGAEVCAIGVWNAEGPRLESPYRWRFSRISMEPGQPDEVATRIGEGAYQLARVSLWCLGLGIACYAVMPLWYLLS